MENEIMDVEVVETNDEVYSGNNGNGVAMLIGAGLTAAAFAVYKIGKKAWDNHKARKTKGVIKFKKNDETKNDDVVIVSSDEETGNE